MLYVKSKVYGDIWVGNIVDFGGKNIFVELIVGVIFEECVIVWFSEERVKEYFR